MDTNITDNRTAAATELERARAAEAQALATVAELTAKLNLLQAEQIDGSHPALVPLWNKIRRIADNAGYADYYDTLAEELGGVLRDRTYTVTLRTIVEVDVPVQVSAANEDAAETAAREQMTPSLVISALSTSGWREISMNDGHVTEQ